MTDGREDRSSARADRASPGERLAANRRLQATGSAFASLCDQPILRVLASERTGTSAMKLPKAIESKNARNDAIPDLTLWKFRRVRVPSGKAGTSNLKRVSRGGSTGRTGHPVVNGNETKKQRLTPCPNAAYQAISGA
jgi:hypothetical protein